MLNSKILAKLFALVVMLLLSPIVATALAAPDPQQAVTAYRQGEFDQAAKGFEDLLAEGHINGHVYYNLGNTYYRLGRQGEAMAAYLAARRYLPRNPDVRANIRFLLKGIPDKLDSSLNEGATQILSFWVRPFTIREWAIGTAIMAFLAALVIAAGVWRRNFKYASLLALVLPVIGLTGTLLSENLDTAWGAVSAKTASVRSGPGAKDAVIFELREGAPFAVVGSLGTAAYNIQLSDGKRGWIAVSDARVFGEL